MYSADPPAAVIHGLTFHACFVGIPSQVNKTERPSWRYGVFTAVGNRNSAIL
jgi:hypothetical protein